MKRNLKLRSESLSELTLHEMTDVAGGAMTGQGHTCPIVACYTGLLTRDCYTYNCCTGSASC